LNALFNSSPDGRKVHGRLYEAVHVGLPVTNHAVKIIYTAVVVKIVGVSSGRGPFVEVKEVVHLVVADQTSPLNSGNAVGAVASRTYGYPVTYPYGVNGVGYQLLVLLYGNVGCSHSMLEVLVT
jgi:hypothetical protein